MNKLAGNRAILERGDEGYPQALLDLENPVERLYVIGDPEALQGDLLTIVGARHATPYGRECARRFAASCAIRGVTVVSGGARGCDAAAHAAALEYGGRTVAVLGGGCDRLYPAANAELFQRIVDAGGAVVSEHEWEEEPRPYHFRARNRITAALSRGLLIAEAGLPSGTFSTADEALALGRAVMAVPGPIDSRASSGSNRLIYQGATPIVDDESFEETMFSLFGAEPNSKEAGK